MVKKEVGEIGNVNMVSTFQTYPFGKNLLYFSNFITDLCSLELDPATVCPNGEGYIKSFFVAPPSATDDPIDCPVYPFLIQRKFDCEATTVNIFEITSIVDKLTIFLLVLVETGFP